MALVLTRNIGEKVMIETSDGVIEVVVTRSDRGQVGLAFTAEKRVPIHREEIWQKIQREKAAACTGNGDRCDKCKGHPEFCPEAKSWAA